MTTRNLEIFAAVAECGSMSAAARKLHISQSAVSQVIVEIERKYGVLLFERYSHTLHLTQIGKTLLDYAREALLLNQETETFLLGSKSRSLLRVGASITVGSSVLCPVLDQLRSVIPDISIQVVVTNTHEIEHKLINYDLDIGLVEGQLSHEDLVEECACQDGLVMVCGKGHPFYGREQVKLEELNGQSFLMREEGSGTRAQLERELRRHHVNYDVSWVSNNPDVIIKALKYNFGITALSPRVVSDYLSSGEMWSFQVRDLDLRREFTLVYHKDKYPVEAFARFRQICLALGEKKEN